MRSILTGVLAAGILVTSAAGDMGRSLATGGRNYEDHYNRTKENKVLRGGSWGYHSLSLLGSVITPDPARAVPSACLR